MSIDVERRPLVAALRQELHHELEALRGNWFWFVILGISLVILGTVALGSVVIASLAAATAIGVLLLLGGAAEAVGAFWCRGWSGFFLELLSGVLSIVVGLLFLRRRPTPAGPDAAPGVLPDGRRVLQDRDGRESIGSPRGAGRWPAGSST